MPVADSSDDFQWLQSFCRIECYDCYCLMIAMTQENGFVVIVEKHFCLTESLCSVSSFAMRPKFQIRRQSCDTIAHGASPYPSQSLVPPIGGMLQSLDNVDGDASRLRRKHSLMRIQLFFDRSPMIVSSFRGNFFVCKEHKITESRRAKYSSDEISINCQKQYSSSEK